MLLGSKIFSAGRCLYSKAPDLPHPGLFNFYRVSQSYSNLYPYCSSDILSPSHNCSKFSFFMAFPSSPSLLIEILPLSLKLAQEVNSDCALIFTKFLINCLLFVLSWPLFILPSNCKLQKYTSHISEISVVPKFIMDSKYPQNILPFIFECDLRMAMV